MSKLDAMLDYLARDGYGTPIGYLDTVSECRAELRLLRRAAQQLDHVLEAERRELWITFHTPAAQKAADEMLTRIKSAILKDETGS